MLRFFVYQLKNQKRLNGRGDRIVLLNPISDDSTNRQCKERDGTFDVVLFDCRAAVRRLLDVGSVALLVDNAPTCKMWRKQQIYAQ